MKKKTNWILIAFLINLALLPLALAAAEKAIERSFFFACCQDSSTGDSYCCDRCCVFTWNCLRADMCGDR